VDFARVELPDGDGAPQHREVGSRDEHPGDVRCVAIAQTMREISPDLMDKLGRPNRGLQAGDHLRGE
jgi:hypothetical protein